MIVASIDIGTNTVLLLIAEVDLSSKTINTLHNEQRIPRLGKGLKPGGNVHEEKVKILFDIFSEYSDIIKKYDCEKIFASATNAFRIAANSKDIVKNISEKFGINIEIISGEKEAAFSFLGASDSLKNDDPGFVIDIGGGSTEIIFGKKDDIYFRKSFQIGVVSGTERYFPDNIPTQIQIDSFKKNIKEILQELGKLKNSASFAIAIAGTPTTLVCMNKGLTEFDETKIEGSILTKQAISILIDTLSKLSSEQIFNHYKSVVRGREDILLAGAILLYQIIEMLGLEEIIVSTKGIRHGAIKYNMDKLINEYSEG